MAALGILNERVQEQEKYTKEGTMLSNQKTISVLVDARDFLEQEQAASAIHDKIRFEALQVDHAGDWLGAIPSKGLALHLQDKEFRLTVGHRLGLDIYDSDKCKYCHLRSDRAGLHAMHCSNGSTGDTTVSETSSIRCATARPEPRVPTWTLLYEPVNSVNLQVYKFTRTPTLLARMHLETRDLIRGSDERPGDVTIPAYQ